MAAPVPTLDQVMGGVYDALSGVGSPALPGAIYNHEDDRPTEAELLRAETGSTGTADVWLMDANAETAQGPATDELYTIFAVTVRYLSVRADTPAREHSREAMFLAERARTALEGASGVFAIGGQRQVREEETVSAEGDFVDRDGSRYYEVVLRLRVEARRWS